MPRPRRLPLLATALQYRTEPVVGQLVTGYPKGSPFPVREGGWLFGYNGDWQAHLDSDRASLTDTWDGVNLGTDVCVSDTAISFLVGGPLQQKPLTGGVYISKDGERLDASDFANAPLHTFPPSTTSWVFMRPTRTRSSYPDVLVHGSNIPPAGQGWSGPYQEVTTLVAVISGAFGLSPQAGSYHKGGLRIRNPADAIALEVQSNSTFAPAATISGGTSALLWLNAGLNQTSLQLQVTGSGRQAVVGTPGAAATMMQFGLTNADSVALVTNATGGTPGYTLAMWPAASSPPHLGAGPWAAYTRLYSVNLTAGGNVRWRDSAGVEWIPHAAPGAFIKRGIISGATPTIGSGVANQVLVTLPVVDTVKQNHFYLIRVECEAAATATFTCAQTVSITINGVVLSPFNGAYAINAVRDALQRTWLSVLILYQHTAADAAGPNVVLSVSHAVGASTCQYFNARIFMVGGWYP